MAAWWITKSQPATARRATAGIGQVAFDQLDVPCAGRFSRRPGRKIVAIRTRSPAPEQFVDDVRTDETGAAGDQILGHGTRSASAYLGQPVCGRPGVIFSAFL